MYSLELSNLPLFQISLTAGGTTWTLSLCRCVWCNMSPNIWYPLQKCLLKNPLSYITCQRYVPASCVISDILLFLFPPCSSQDRRRHIGAAPLTKKRLISQLMDKPVLDTTRIEVPVTEKSCIYVLSLYSFKYAERSKSITDGIDHNSGSMDRVVARLKY